MGALQFNTKAQATLHAVKEIFAATHSATQKQ